jgi:transcriptional regulator with XRE-family HTH domain
MDRLAELRERRALTLRELSELSGVAADTINQIELGHRKPRPSTLRKLAKALEVDVEEFYREPALAGKAEAPREAGLSLGDWLKRRGHRGFLAEDTSILLEQIKSTDPQMLSRHRDQLRAEYNEALRSWKEEPESLPPGVTPIEIFMRWFTVNTEAYAHQPDAAELNARVIDELIEEDPQAKSDTEAS